MAPAAEALPHRIGIIGLRASIKIWTRASGASIRVSVLPGKHDEPPHSRAPRRRLEQERNGWAANAPRVLGEVGSAN